MNPHRNQLQIPLASHILYSRASVDLLVHYRQAAATGSPGSDSTATEGDVVNDRLDGWKAVAAHVRKSVRTAQRWERELGLPVRRMPTENGEIVYAFVSEIEGWVRDRERSPRVAKPSTDSLPVAGASSQPSVPVDTFPILPYATGPQVVPSLLIPLSPSPRLVPWLAGGLMLLVGTVLGWLLGHVRLG
jgi:hypothetical protein